MYYRGNTGTKIYITNKINNSNNSCNILNINK